MDRYFRVFALTVVAGLFVSAAAKAEEGESVGRQLYVKYCSGCHKLTDQTSKGPGLQGVTGRHTEEWIDKWLQGPKEMIESGDPDALTLKSHYRFTMPTIKAMADKDTRRIIIDFLKENDKNLAQ